MERTECTLIVKVTSLVNRKINCEDFTNIKKVTDEDIPVTHTLYNLLGESDALITDYSSVYIDYLLLDKPIGFMYDDLEEYRKARGFIFEPITDYMPGMKMSNLDQLIIFINNICVGIDNYKNDRNKVNLMFNKFMDDQSSFRFIKEVGLLELLESKNG
ncbi:MAG: CDP-glycerol glycerophosphotransferase family protein [Methanobacterium sp.]